MHFKHSTLELHDPDYQDFAKFPTAAGETSRGRRKSDPSRIRPQSQWLEDEFDMEEYDAEEELHYQSRRLDLRSPRRTPHRPRSAQHSSAQDFHSAYSPSSSITSSPASSYSPLPLSSSTPYLSVFDPEEKPHSHNRHCLIPKQLRRISFTSQLEAKFFDNDDDDEHEQVTEQQRRADFIAERDTSILHSMTDMTYSQALKKQWVAISLSIQIRLFRARKRASSLSSLKPRKD
eukprot:GHVO01000593.1.p1 GENE.GHVO01000593.1~~GHVO01000593.1.p1  ORF type:complete len:233 (-),score=19.73 GHVO01000593.1:266-964(-)